MVNSRHIETLKEIYLHVGDNEFTARDLPPAYRYFVKFAEIQGYLIKVGTAKRFYYDRNKEFTLYRISARYLEKLK